MHGHDTALVVDGNENDRSHISRVLYDRLGFSTVYPAADSRAAVALLHGTQVDWVFSAWDFGGSTSHRLFDLLRNHRQLCRVPRVLLFDGDHDTARSIARDTAASDYVRKPLVEESLVRATHRVCSLLRRQTARTRGLDCELDLGFDEFNVYPAELRDITARDCLLQVPQFKEQVGAVGDIGTLTIRCPDQGALVLNGRVAHVRASKSKLPCRLLEVRFELAEPAPATCDRLRALIRTADGFP